jgi:hypothetical protein
MAARDRQRSRVYAWKHRVIAPRDLSQVSFPAVQGMVDAIWSELGLRYPPSVEPLPAQARTRLADASRLILRLRPIIPSWCLLHELAHAMTSTHDGQSDGHGPIFVGIYVQLLGRYLRFDETWLLRTLQEAGVVVCPNARPAVLDR